MQGIEFLVEETPVRKNSTQWEIVGRCSTDLAKGTQFTQAIPYSIELDNQHKSYEVRKEGGFPVLLTVEKMLSWEREWDLINAGMAARLLVSGDASKIHKRMLLVA